MVCRWNRIKPTGNVNRPPLATRKVAGKTRRTRSKRRRGPTSCSEIKRSASVLHVLRHRFGNHTSDHSPASVTQITDAIGPHSVHRPGFRSTRPRKRRPRKPSVAIDLLRSFSLNPSGPLPVPGSRTLVPSLAQPMPVAFWLISRLFTKVWRTRPFGADHQSS